MTGVVAVLLVTNWFTGGNAAALLGAMALWVSGLLGVTWFETVISRRFDRFLAGGDREELAEVASVQHRQVYWPVKLVTQFLPGLWIGAQAESPLPIVVAYVLLTEALGGLGTRISAPEIPLTRGPHIEGVLRKAGLLLIGTAVAVIGKHWLRM